MSFYLIAMPAKWVAFFVAWFGWALQLAGDGCLRVARWLHPEWE